MRETAGIIVFVWSHTDHIEKKLVTPPVNLGKAQMGWKWRTFVVVIPYFASSNASWLSRDADNEILSSKGNQLQDKCEY